MEKEVANIKNQSLKLTWHMRGGVSYTDIMNMSIDERNMIAQLISENMDTTKKTGLPFF
jgi:hypothetical protein